MNQIIKVWIDISKNDIASSKILYESGNYRNSYYLFQQATEKANKAFALINETLTETELKKIQHNQTKIYRKAIIEQDKRISETIDLLKNIEIPEGLEILSPEQLKIQQKSFKKGISFIDSLRNCDLINIKEKDLNEFIVQIKELKDFEFELPENYNAIIKNKMLEIINWIGQFDTIEAKSAQKEMQEFLNDKKEFDKYVLSYKTIIFPLISDLIFISYTLYCCAILTIQHSSLSRYPSDDINPEDIYINKLPIVKKQIEFVELLKVAVLKMEKMILKEKIK